MLGKDEPDRDSANAVERGNSAPAFRFHRRNLARASRRKSPRHAEVQGTFAFPSFAGAQLAKNR